MTLEEAFYEERFRNLLLTPRGDAFQTVLERLMAVAHAGNFMACRPWGNQGDRKNDALLRSESRLFQV